MRTLLNYLKTCDDWLLRVLLIVYVFFIPLYPKFPFKFIEYTYIAIRLEDFYIGLLVIVFIISLLRRKISLNTRLLIPILLFWAVAFISYLIGSYVTETIRIHNLGFLHATRRVEYMIVFFIASSTVRSTKDFTLMLTSLIISFTLVNLYGVGQRFLGLPAVQTMNPEFARGRILYLTPEARLSSTFSGHYDLATYVVFMIPLVLGVFLGIKNRVKIRLLLFALVLLSIFILVLTASRISFVAYTLSLTLFLLLYARKWLYWLLLMIFTASLLFSNQELAKRFKKTVQIKQIVVNEQTGQVFVPQKITTKELPAGSFYIPVPKKTSQKVSTTSSQISATDSTRLKKQVANEILHEEYLKTRELLSASEQARMIASISAFLKPVKGFTCDISCSTRLQVEWPRAIAAFLTNPLIGTGPSSITEATDNDFLRWLGEFGAIGFGLFMFIFIKIGIFITTKAKKMDGYSPVVFHSVLFSLVGLLINATYIDVFEASKIAFMFWYTIGIIYGVLSSRSQTHA